MKTLFNSQDLVESGYEEASNDEARLKENQKRDATALFFIQQAVDESIFLRIAAATSAKQAWSLLKIELLKIEYQGSANVTTIKLQSLRHDFETSYMNNNESAQEYLAKISSIVSQMRSYGDSISDEVIVAKVLRSFAPKFDHVVAAIEESKDLSMFSFDELMGSLQAHEVRINMSFAKEEEKNGHTEKFCWSKLEEAKYAEENEEQEDFLFMAKTDTEMAQSDIWYINSGCSHHITGDKSNFKDLDEFSKKAFPVGKSRRADDVLELIHADLCSPIRVESLGGNRGGEFLSKEFVAFCDDHGIKRELTAPYSPDQNGVAERKNRIVVEMTRSTLKSKSLHNSFWAEGVATAVYLLNISPTKAVWNETPYEAWCGNKPSVSHLRVFGCICYALCTIEKHKPEEKSQKFIFVGYFTQSKAYRLYDPTHEKIVVNRNVLFDKSSSWKWDNDIEISNSQLKMEEEEEEVLVENVANDTPSTSQAGSLKSTPNRSNSGSDSDASSEESMQNNRKFRSIDDIYAASLLILFAGDPLSVEEAIKKEEWQRAMEDELQAINKI
ncbi:retrovirus-related pol polyprotein from transposon TNT 1-94 [Tanacetum coccineum]